MQAKNACKRIPDIGIRRKTPESGQNKIEPRDITVRCLLNIHQQRRIKQKVPLVPGFTGEVKLRGQNPVIPVSHLDVIVRRAAAIFGGADGFEKVPTFGIGFLITAQPETAIVIFAVAIGMPKIDDCATNRLAIAVQDKPDQSDWIAIRIGTKIGFFRGLLAVKRAFGAAAGWLIIGATGWRDVAFYWLGAQDWRKHPHGNAGNAGRAGGKPALQQAAAGWYGMTLLTS